MLMRVMHQNNLHIFFFSIVSSYFSNLRIKPFFQKRINENSRIILLINKQIISALFTNSNVNLCALKYKNYLSCVFLL